MAGWQSDQPTGSGGLGLGGLAHLVFVCLLNVAFSETTKVANDI